VSSYNRLAEVGGLKASLRSFREQNSRGLKNRGAKKKAISKFPANPSIHKMYVNIGKVGENFVLAKLNPKY
jgi:hypothetical protein